MRLPCAPRFPDIALNALRACGPPHPDAADHEYDLSVHGTDNYETRTNWQKYRDYHQKFGDIVNLLGGGEWMAVDPTFGQVPADATHIKLVEGDSPEEMAAIAGIVGKITARVVEQRY